MGTVDTLTRNNLLEAEVYSDGDICVGTTPADETMITVFAKYPGNALLQTILTLSPPPETTITLKRVIPEANGVPAFEEIGSPSNFDFSDTEIGGCIFDLLRVIRERRDTLVHHPFSQKEKILFGLFVNTMFMPDKYDTRIAAYVSQELLFPTQRIRNCDADDVAINILKQMATKYDRNIQRQLEAYLANTYITIRDNTRHQALLLPDWASPYTRMHETLRQTLMFWHWKSQ